MKATLKSPWGNVSVELENAQLMCIRGDTDRAVFFGQGYGTARLRLWQLDLSRRVASGRLAEILGDAALRTDVFQRRLGLTELAKRAQATDASAAPDSWQGQQYQHVQSYIDGINYALESAKARPAESWLLGYRIAPFSVTDAYLLAQLKYFINSAWQYELFHTRLAGKLTQEQHRQLFTTFSEEGSRISPLPLDAEGQWLPMVEKALKDGLSGLSYLGMSSPDTGSNVIAVSGRHTASGKPILAADPHMGYVNPGFNLLCKLVSDEGLDAIGSHFPGAPGIIVGRNRHASWGMVGIMADNQDLFFGQIDLEAGKVKTADGWVALTEEKQLIARKSGSVHEFIARGFSEGRLLMEKGNYGLFLRWPALEKPDGDITFHALSKCHDWQSFRDALSRVNNSPMMVGYADVHGDIGLQAMGMIPRRLCDMGSLVMDLTNPDHQWRGYVPFDQLPSSHNPPEGYAVYANQYSDALFNGRQPLSNRWHSPSRAKRVAELIRATSKHTAQTLAAVQDDKVDYFARQALPVLLPYLTVESPLSQWDGDTRRLECARLFDQWIQHLMDNVLAKALKRGARALYADFWPGCRWNLIMILKEHLSAWGFEQESVAALVQESYDKALISSAKMTAPWVEYQHTIKRPGWLKKLLTGRYPYQGGNRETVHATRQNADFLTQSQSSPDGQLVSKPYTFGPGFKLISDMESAGDIHYMTNMPAGGSPFFWRLGPTLSRWQKGLRFIARVDNK
ncbi:penicillin acylase family protein [Leminorella grimontii]|uniref:penicillin acylase family protein n=1 Tax=Leminorella grimontii TaxID=82981 RepID=UPI00321FAD22